MVWRCYVLTIMLRVTTCVQIAIKYTNKCDPRLAGQQYASNDRSLSERLLLFPRLRHTQYGSADRQTLLEQSAY